MPLTDNLLAYWKLDESNGNPVDATGNGNTLTNVNSVAFATGKINNGADFGSTNSNKLLGRSSNFGVTGGSASLSVWFKIDAQPGSGDFQNVIRLSENTNKTHLHIRYENNGGTYSINYARSKNGVGDQAVVRNGQLTTGTWYFAAVTYNGTTLEAFLDGSSVGTVAASGNGSGDNPNYRTTGGWYNSALSYFYPLKGMVDELGLWSRALSSTEITQLYNGGSGFSHPFTPPATGPAFLLNFI
jgi:hypothetical protein